MCWVHVAKRSHLSCALVGLSLQEVVLNRNRIWIWIQTAIRIQRLPAVAYRRLNRSWRPSDLTGSQILNQSLMMPSKMIQKQYNIKQVCNYRWPHVNELFSPSSCLYQLAFCHLDRPTPSAVWSPGEHISNSLMQFLIAFLCNNEAMRCLSKFPTQREYLVAVFAGFRVRAGWWFRFWGRSTLLSISITGWCPCSLHWWTLKSYCCFFNECIFFNISYPYSYKI